jgi:hypothetical protein
MRPIINVLVLVCALSALGNAYSQQAALVDDFILDAARVVNDPDGFANVRSGPSLKSKIVDQVISGGVVTVEEALAGDWAKLTSGDGGDPPRYMHATRLSKINDWKQIGAHPTADGKTCLAQLPGFEVQVRRIPFKADEHVITRDDQGVHLVDGKMPWGRDGGLPEASLVLAVRQGGKSVAIPAAATRDLYEPNMDSLFVLTPSDPAGQALVLMLNSDGAGAYGVIWAFQNGSYRGRAVFNPF